MGWMRTLLLGDIGNRMDIADAERSIDSLRSQQHSARSEIVAKEREIKRLEKEVGQLKLATQALTRFLVMKGLVHEGELNSFIEKVDAEDGVVDGQLSLDDSQVRLKLVRPDAHTWEI
ncbi:MAG: hypothetical protein Q7Q71_09425 [Verrucomicrobiota bacterium JB023]|nr:hypothetical protein [Verrucomicrobiota bacterium JB023]